MMARRNTAPLSAQGGMSFSLERGRASIVSTRFCGVGAWRVRSISAVFLRSRDHGSEDTVVFSGIGDDGYFEHSGWAGKLVSFVWP